MATFDGATGKLLANSTIVNAAGALSGITNLTAIIAPSLIPLGAQTVDVAYNQANLQTTIDLIVADITSIITALNNLGLIN